METIQIKNLRLLKDTGAIALKPITILLGSNGSGKSTFLRTLPLLKQSIELRTSSPILWYAGEGGYVDFGSFNEAVFNFDSNQKISFGFSENLSLGGILYKSEKRTINFNFLCEISFINEQNITNLYCINFGEHQVKIILSENGTIKVLTVNNQDFSDHVKEFRNVQGENIIPYFADTEFPSLLNPTFSRTPFLSELFKRILIKKIKSQILGQVSTETISQIFDRINGEVCKEKEILNILSTPKDPKSWQKKVASWDYETAIYQEIRDLFVGYSCFILLERFRHYFTKFCQNTSYSKPIRATAERYYRYQDLAIREVEPNGANLAMFIKALQDEKDNRLKLFQEWTEQKFGFSVSIHSLGGHLSLKVKEKNSQQEEKNSQQAINLADTGFGFSQILPIITQLWWLLYKGGTSRGQEYPVTFAIEQPELHLHPKLQALLADAFVAVVDEAKQKGIELKLIIETHSETIVNRLGGRIANRDLDHDDINVAIFEKNPNDNFATVQIAKYDQEGFLDNWPIGFFEPNII